MLLLMRAQSRHPTPAPALNLATLNPHPCCCPQDVVEIMRQTLDSQVASGGGGLECLDFTRGGGGGGRAGSQAGERRRFLEALGWHCQVGAGGRAGDG